MGLTEMMGMETMLDDVKRMDKRQVGGHNYASSHAIH